MKYNNTNSRPTTTLDAMVHAGKTLYFANGCCFDSVLMGQLHQPRNGGPGRQRGQVWGHFLEKSCCIRYAVSCSRVRGRTANVPEIDKTCPGRWASGWNLQIVAPEAWPSINVPLAH
jgi:hypothetical protein